MQRDHKKIERLMLFGEVAQHLSFTLAADKLGISRGYLSEQVRRLEQELGTPLLVRTTRSVRLTEQGLRVQQGTDHIRRSLIDLERSIVHDHSALEGVIKITAPVIFTERYLLDICHAFSTEHAGIRFSIDCSYTNYDLTQSHLDLAFRVTQNPPGNMVAKALFSYQHYCCASPSYFQQHGRPTRPSDLHQHQCLHGPEQAYWEFIDGDISTQGWMEINNNQLLKREALLGRGIIRAPQYLVDQEIHSGELERVLADVSTAKQMVYIIHPQLIHQPERLKAFIRFTQDWFKQDKLSK